MSDTRLVYEVPGVSCAHCKAAISEEVLRLAGVEAVEVDLDTKQVTVTGSELDDAAVRDAIEEAGYELGH